MVRQLPMLILTISLTGVVLKDCNKTAPAQPDFVPVKTLGIPAPGGFCDTDKSNPSQLKLKVTIKNQGNQSGSAPVVVDFRGVRSAPQSTSALAPGALTTPPLLFDMPGSCFSPDCAFKIIIDPNNQVPESDETNNTADGSCVG